MVFCSDCGASNKEGAKFCINCGAQLKASNNQMAQNNQNSEYSEQSTYRNQTYTQPRKKSHKGLIAIVLVILIAGGGLYACAYGHHGYINYEIYSTHLLYEADITVYMDDKQVMAYKGLEPGQYIYNSEPIPVYFSLFNDARVVTIKAVSTGGGLGPQSDTETITIYNGEATSVKLYI